MRIKNAIKAIFVFSIAILMVNCEAEKLEMDEQGYQEKTISSAKRWFKEYESNGSNYDLFQDIEYDWSEASITKSVDGTQTIIVPVIESKKNADEIWSQELYIYKLGERNYKALLFEIYPDKDASSNSQSIDGGNFNGYMSTWDLKTGFVKAAKFVDNQVVENGIAQTKVTGKAPPILPCQDGDCNTDGGGGNPIPLRPVVITTPGTGTPVVYMPRNPVTGGTTPGGYTSPVGGNGGGGSAPTPKPVDPCNKMKGLTDATKAGNMKPSIDWLKAKVMAAVNDKEYGVEVKKTMNPDETFKYEYIQIVSPNQFAVPISIGSTYIGGAHSHPSDGYAMFSFGDVKLLKDAYNEASPSRKEDVFVMLIAKNNAGQVNSYAIRVDDIAALSSKVNAVWDNPKYNSSTDDEKIKKIHDQQAVQYDESNGALEESFLQQFGSFGITIYKADDALTKWDKLEINKATNKATPVPCT
ncbi:hypothetical protein [Flavobacterium aestivum]|uniref:hypothetical protein n=1 Tax=Flavobacterium aestivum TaxID=3003257 RepID=UPI00228692BE|nr:hypothetical protein [Flavobacterium aestivum]